METSRSRASSRRPRVLIVDDEKALRTTLGMLLDDEHDVTSVESGKAARALLEVDRDFDAILCDLMMPGTSGMELHAWLVSRDAALGDRMVFMTGGVFTDEARRFLAHVSNPVIEKPFDPERLRRVIREVERA